MHVLHPYLVKSWFVQSWQVFLNRGGDYGHTIHQILGNFANYTYMAMCGSSNSLIRVSNPFLINHHLIHAP